MEVKIPVLWQGRIIVIDPTMLFTKDCPMNLPGGNGTLLMYVDKDRVMPIAQVVISIAEQN